MKLIKYFLSKYRSIVLIITFMIMFIPYDYFEILNNNILFFIKIICLILMLILLSQKSVWGSFLSLIFVALATNIYANYYFNPTIFSYTDNPLINNSIILGIIEYYFMYLPQKYFIIILSILMIFIVLVTSYKSLKLGYPGNKSNKLMIINYYIQVVLPVIGYLIIIQALIGAFAGMYSTYHNQYYLKYVYPENINTDYIIEDLPTNSNLYNQFNIKVKDTNGDLRTISKVERYYKTNDSDYILNKKKNDKNETEYELQQNTSVKLEPYSIYITNYKSDGNISTSRIDRGFSFSDDDGTEGGTVPFDKFLYFSNITFFTIGYGDVVPTSSETREMVILEAELGHIFSIIVIPILIIVVQALYQKIKLDKNQNSNDIRDINTYNNYLQTNKKYIMKIEKINNKSD